MPDLHTPEEDLWFFRERVFRDCAVWVSEANGIDGFCAFRAGWVDHLYVHPDRHAQGLGSALLGQAMTAHRQLKLWVFQKNLRAIRFYEAHGFRLVRKTDGEDNEEHEPDALYEWRRGRSPAAGVS
nr:GNAT family N-acetyltransferase [Limobrevibacterium gyesilva]